MSVWDRVVGQEEVVATLRAAASQARRTLEGAKDAGDAGGAMDSRDAGGAGAGMTHAWLITGPPGSGRSVAARAFAAALECTSLDELGCGQCRNCTTTLVGTHPDVEVVATEKVVIQIEDVRELIGVAQRAPALGRWRVVIVEDADRMAERTTNVLLKAIEEPPERTVWLLCAPSPDDVIPTVRSRCRGVRLTIPSPQAVTALLVERDGVDPALALDVAREAQSHVGRARYLARSPEARARRSALLHLPGSVRGVGDAVVQAQRLVEASVAAAKARTEERDATEKAELLRNLGIEEGARVPPTLRAQVRDLEEDQKRRARRAQRDELDRDLTDLLSFFRDVLVVQLGAGIDLVNSAEAAEVGRLAEALTPQQTVDRLEAIADARRRIAANVTPLLAIEAMFVALRPQQGASR